ncbi:MAG: helix-turn-helix transcriptional regulator [Clostridia bacterium]|nr:helix-turn-helix transcriptional regulator [Clostridia bacterium]
MAKEKTRTAKLTGAYLQKKYIVVDPGSRGKTKFHINNLFLDDPKVFGDITLYQIGRRYCESGAVIGMHFHGDFYELSIVTAGEGYIMTDEGELRVRPGDIHLSLPREHHDIRTVDGEKLEYDFLAFSVNSKYVSSITKIADAVRGGECSRLFRDERVSYLIALAISEVSLTDAHSSDMMCSILKQVIIYVIRNLTGAYRLTANVNNAEILCQNVMSYIDSHIYSVSSLKEVSDRFGYNYSYLSDLFSKTTGNTVSEYYRSRRLDAARALLDEGKKPISEISELLGYSTPFAFSAAFKKHFGLSPKEFAKTKMGEEAKE